MAQQQQIILADQLVCTKYQGIVRCNNYALLQNIPCSVECKIIGHILIDHALSYALTATVDVPVVHLLQFWKTVKKVPNANETIRFMLDRKEITYTVDMFCLTLQLPMETLENPFIAPATLEYIQPFILCSRCSTVVLPREHLDMIRQINIIQIFHVVVNRVHVDYAALLWWDFLHCVQQKKDVIQYPHFTKVIIADLMKKFSFIPQRLEEDYQSIKDDIPLVSVYTTGNVTVRGMLIPNEFLTDALRATRDIRSMQSNVVQNKRKRKQVAGETSSPKPSFMIRVKQMKPSTTPIPLPSNDKERNEIAEATLLSLTMHKTALAAKA
ncbi:hypothetical protein Tco_1456348 [Tanacetum coccineum]